VWFFVDSVANDYAYRQEVAWCKLYPLITPTLN
jgi:hypothetical protein